MSDGQNFISFPASKDLKKRVKKMAHRLEKTQAEYIRGLILADLQRREARVMIKKETTHGLIKPSKDSHKITPLAPGKDQGKPAKQDPVIDKEFFND